MINIEKPIAFVLVSTNHGMMIVNKHDYRDYKNDDGKNVRNGIGHQLLETSSYEPEEIDFAIGLLIARRRYYGDGMVVIDCGANIGEIKLVLDNLNKNKHIFQKYIAFAKLKSKFTPKINFYIDNTFDEAEKIEKLLLNKKVIRDLENE